MVLGRLRRGAINLLDVCDAHPELLRAARNIGRPLDRSCPVCSNGTLRLVRYVYGDQLGQLSGRVVYPEGWVRELMDRYSEFRCYAIEVCIDCSWNFLLAVYLLGSRYRPQRANGSVVAPG